MYTFYRVLLCEAFGIFVKKQASISEQGERKGGKEGRGKERKGEREKKDRGKKPLVTKNTGFNTCNAVRNLIRLLIGHL